MNDGNANNVMFTADNHICLGCPADGKSQILRKLKTNGLFG